MIIHYYEKELMSFYAYYVHKRILLIVPPILLIIGTVGNALSFVVLNKYKSRNSTYAYLCVLAVLDLLVLYIGLLRIWVAQVWDYDLRNETNWLCKITVFLGYVCSDASVWIIVAVTAERLIAVYYPFKATVLCDIRITRIFTGVAILALCCVNLHFFWSVELINTVYNVTQCYAVERYDILVNDIWPWVDAAIYSFVPTIIIIILNTMIVIQIVKAKRKRKLLYHDNNEPEAEVNKNRIVTSNRKITLMLLMISVTFLFTTFPNSIILIISAIWSKRYGENHKRMATVALIQTITEMLMYANHAVNFLLYCASGRKFRTQLAHVCFRKKNSFQSCEIKYNTIVMGSLRNTKAKFV